MVWTKLQDRWTRFSASSQGKGVIRWTKRGLLATIGIYLVWKLREIGWQAVWAERPKALLFYALFLLIYFSLPLTEILIYRVTWRYDMWRSVPAFIKKRIYNKGVLGYSGEVYFYGWASKNLHLTDREIAETIRDNNIISSVASTLVALSLIFFFLTYGELNLQRWIGKPNWTYLGVAVVLLAVLVPLAIRYRRYLYAMPLKATLAIFVIQCVRLLVGQVLQIAQWAVVMPDVALNKWFTLAAVSLIISRIPALPNQSVVLMGVAVELSTRLGIPTAGMFSMMGVLAALEKVMNVGLFTLLTLWEKKKGGAQMPRPKNGPEEAP